MKQGTMTQALAIARRYREEAEWRNDTVQARRWGTVVELLLAGDDETVQRVLREAAEAEDRT